MGICSNFTYKLTTTYVGKYSHKYFFVNNKTVVLKTFKLLKSK